MLLPLTAVFDVADVVVGGVVVAVVDDVVVLL